MSRNNRTLTIVLILVLLAIPAGIISYVAFFDDNQSEGRWAIEPVKNLVYDGQPHELVTVLTANGTIYYQIGDSDFSTAIPTAIDAGTYTINYKITNNENELSSGTIDVKIEPKDIIVKVGDYEKMLGEPDPVFTTECSEDLNGDAITYELSREAGEGYGTYQIFVTGEAVQGNYRVDYQNGTLIIYNSVVTVYVDDATKVYGAKDPQFTARVSDESAGIEYTLYRDSGESAGNYKIHATGERLQNHHLVEFEFGYLTIKETSSSWEEAPKAVETITYDGKDHQLITSGSPIGGTAYYKLSNGKYSTSIPVASEPDTYVVVYKIVGDKNHADSEEGLLIVEIREDSWNGKEERQPAMVDGKYQVYLASELAWIASHNASNKGYANATISLMHDINLNNHEWSPIGTEQSPFKGKIEGNGHTVSGLLVTKTASYAGLFGYTNGGSISDLTLNDAEIAASEYVAALAGYLNSVTKNVTVMHADVSGNRYVGGIAGYQKAPVSDSLVSYMSVTCNRTTYSDPYDISYKGNDAGGIAGMSNANIERCTVSHLIITAYKDVGGIAGNIQENVDSISIKGCYADCTTIIYNVNGGNAEPIVGRSTDNAVVSNNNFSYTVVRPVANQTTLQDAAPSALKGELDYIIITSANNMIYSKDGVETTVPETHNLTLDGVTINAAEGRPAILVEEGGYITIVIKNEVYLKGGKDADGIRVVEGAEAVITGNGTLTVIGNNGLEYENEDGYRDNGTPDYDNKGGSGIGNAGSVTGTIRINKLSGLYAYGYGLRAYGIGGDGATVTIDNSRIEIARGGFDETEFLVADYGLKEAEGAPAIGGEIIKIQSKSVIVKAIGGSKAAAIGSRFWCGTDILIEDSTVEEAIGGNGSAGIGSSHPARTPTEATVVKITIVNSKINVIGGYYGAGIGSGYDRYTGSNGWTDLTINIMSYSEIKAEGGQYGADIGTGFHSGILKGSIDHTVMCFVTEGTVVKDKDTYSYVAQSIGYGVVDMTREASSLVDGSTLLVPEFTVDGVNITNPFDTDRMTDVRERYPAS